MSKTMDTLGSAPGGLVQFDEIPLVAAAETINQESATKLVVSDRKITGLRVSRRLHA